MNHQALFDTLRYLLLGAWPEGPLGGAALTILLSAASASGSAVIGLVWGVGLAWPVPAWRTRGPVRVLSGVSILLLAVAWATWWWRWLEAAGAIVLAIVAVAIGAVALRRGRALLLALTGLLRAVPILLLMFWIYFLVPVLFGLDVPGNATVVLALSLVGGAYLAHAVRAGIAALPVGQWRACAALGIGTWDSLRLVILPQALPAMLPSFLNQWLSLCKDTSLGYVIAVGELSFVATQVSNRLMVHPAEVFGFAALLYFVLCGALQLSGGLAARRWQPAAVETGR